MKGYEMRSKGGIGGIVGVAQGGVRLAEQQVKAAVGPDGRAGQARGRLGGGERLSPGSLQRLQVGGQNHLLRRG